MPTHSDNSRLTTIDALRGLAAAAVALFQFAGGNGLFELPGWIAVPATYGGLGVQVFFVISGFIIPYALYRGGYQRNRDFGRFLLKRVARIDPPYLVSIAVCFAVGWLLVLIPGYTGKPPEATPWQLLLHLGYLSQLFHQPWVIPVYWTLAIEFQYYLLVALLFPLLSSTRVVHRLGTVITLLVLSTLMKRHDLVFHWCPLFILGIATFQHHSRLIRIPELLIVWLAAMVVGGMDSWLQMLTGLATALLIGFVRFTPPRILLGLGAISYSLYLLHVPIGMRVINLGVRFPDHPAIRVATLVAAFAVSLVAAYVMYILVERPAQRFSSRLRYHRGASSLHQGANSRPVNSGALVNSSHQPVFVSSPVLPTAGPSVSPVCSPADEGVA